MRKDGIRRASRANRLTIRWVLREYATVLWYLALIDLTAEVVSLIMVVHVVSVLF